MISAATTAYRQRRYINAHHTHARHSATTNFSSDRAPAPTRQTVDPYSGVVTTNCYSKVLSETSAVPLDIFVYPPKRLSSTTVPFSSGSAFSSLRAKHESAEDASRRDPIRIAIDRTDLGSTFRFIRCSWTVCTAPTGAPQRA